MYQTLLSLEKAFFDVAHISDAAWLDSVLHREFQECGRTGALFDKADTVQALLACGKGREIVIYNFAYQPVRPGCWLVHYITVSDGVQYYRTSLWVQEGGMKLLFHQATPLHMDMRLHMC